MGACLCNNVSHKDQKAEHQAWPGEGEGSRTKGVATEYRFNKINGKSPGEIVGRLCWLEQAMFVQRVLVIMRHAVERRH